MMRSYLHILQDSLIKKSALLREIEEKSKEQSELIKNPDKNLAAIDLNMDEKNLLIQEVLKIDEGFEHLYQRIKQELEENKAQYKEEILKIKALISEVTEKSTSIQVIEARNKTEMDVFFSKQKKGIQTKRNAMSVARDYYQNMNKVKHVSPQFMDHKK